MWPLGTQGSGGLGTVGMVLEGFPQQNNSMILWSNSLPQRGTKNHSKGLAAAVKRILRVEKDFSFLPRVVPIGNSPPAGMWAGKELSCSRFIHEITGETLLSPFTWDC